MAASMTTISEGESVVSSVEQDRVWAEAVASRAMTAVVSGTPETELTTFRAGPRVLRSRAGPVLVRASGSGKGQAVILLPAFGSTPAALPSWTAAFEQAGYR